MTPNDLTFIKSLNDRGLLKSPVLELGSGYGGETCRQAIESFGHKYFTTDLSPGPGVDYAADFETARGLDQLLAAGPFGSVLVLNVMEHTFNPIAVLDNVVKTTALGGTIITVTPAVWPLHNYPVDCCRLLPDWYRRFAESRSLELPEDYFVFISEDSVQSPVNAFRDANGQDRFPPPRSGRRLSRTYSRAVHKLFRTFGRGMMQPSHIAIGAVFIRPAR
jgi:SAM-dependent methyltransferase